MDLRRGSPQIYTPEILDGMLKGKENLWVEVQKYNHDYCCRHARN